MILSPKTLRKFYRKQLECPCGRPVASLGLIPNLPPKKGRTNWVITTIQNQALMTRNAHVVPLSAFRLMMTRTLTFIQATGQKLGKHLAGETDVT